jgi:hypothetical protein
VKQAAPATKYLTPGGQPPSALRVSKRGKDDITRSEEALTPNQIVAPRPSGSSPMAREDGSLELVDMELNEDEVSKAKSDLSADDELTGDDRGDEEDRVGRAIASTRKNLFESDKFKTPGDKSNLVKKGSRLRWRPISKWKRRDTRFPSWAVRKELSSQTEHSSTRKRQSPPRRLQARTQRCMNASSELS